jgi:hypothetical protein
MRITTLNAIVAHSSSSGSIRRLPGGPVIVQPGDLKQRGLLKDTLVV